MVTVLVVVLLCVLYGVASTLYSKKDKVYLAEAGSVDNASHGSAMVQSAPSKIVRLNDGRRIRTSDYIRILIDGDCMTKRGVLRNEEWLVEPLTLSENDNRIKPHDILLIHLADKHIYKIREFVGYDDNGDLNTLYYEEGNKVKPSSKPHSRESVCGVLRYSI